MKRLLIIFLLAISHATYSQITSISADLGVGVPNLTDLSNNPINPNAVGHNSISKLKFSITNYEQNTPIPDHTFQVVVGLGSKFIVDPAYNLATAPLSNYFSWTQAIFNGEVQITGTLIGTLPADFSINNTAVFNVKAVGFGGPAIISDQLAFPNDNPSFNLTDPNPVNNNATLNYTVVGSLPVTYTNFVPTQVGCDIRADWSLGSELNVRKYIVEASKDGVTFANMTEIAARGASNYSATFALTDLIKAPMIFVRIKAVDLDGSLHYSDVKSVSGSCDQKQPWKLYVYPNPVSYRSDINIAAKEGSFTGKYRFTLVDNAGKTYSTSEVTLDNVKSYNYKFGSLAAGKYIVRVSSVDGAQNTTVEFEKL